MKSNSTKNNYNILLTEERFPITVNKKQTDKVIEQLLKNCSAIADLLTNLYTNNYDLYKLLVVELFEDASINIDEGKNWKLNYLINKLTNLQQELQQNNDIIKSVEEIITLDDLGYNNKRWLDPNWYEKIVVDNDTEEVVEEIHLLTTGPIRKLRTIIWERTDYGKSSKSITYKELKITKKLAQAIKNTFPTYYNQQGEFIYDTTRGK